MTRAWTIRDNIAISRLKALLSADWTDPMIMEEFIDSLRILTGKTREELLDVAVEDLQTVIDEAVTDASERLEHCRTKLATDKALRQTLEENEADEQ